MASATLSKRSELLGGRSDHDDDGDEEANGYEGELSTDGQRKAAHPQSQHLGDAAPPEDDATVVTNIVEITAPLARKETGTAVVPHAGRQAWVEALGAPLELSLIHI